MNIGQIDRQNQELIHSYKAYGFATKTEMINRALVLLAQELARERRHKKLLQAALDYAESGVQEHWSTIDAEDFES